MRLTFGIHQALLSLFCLVIGIVHLAATKGTGPLPPTISIVGGIAANAGEFPYMARLKIQKYMCGGTLIGPYHILTAAHCFDNYVPGGSTDVATVYLNTLFTNGGGNGSVTATSGKYIIHELYDPNDPAMANDVALIVLRNPVTTIPFSILPIDPAKTTTARPTTSAKKTTKMTIIKQTTKKFLVAPKSAQQTLSRAFSEAFSTYEKMPAIVAGWGRTSPSSSPSPVLLKTNLTILDNTVCIEKYSDFNSDMMLCAQAPGRDTCGGDSGGPILVGGVQVGITSYGSEYCNSTGVYTRVSNYLDWIQTNQAAHSVTVGSTISSIG